MINKGDELSFDPNRLSHAYIVGVAAVSDTLAMAVVCGTRDGVRPCMRCSHCDKASRHIHPDIIVVDKLDDKREIVVDQIRELKQDVYVVPNEAMQKAYVVNNADSMNKNAQNAFLQILEEPPLHAVFILCTMSPAALLRTVRSRCIKLKSWPVEGTYSLSDDDEPGELVMDFLAAFGRDNVSLMECMFRLDKLDRLAFSAFLTSAREQIAVSLREGSTHDRRRMLVHAESILVRAGEMLDLNVSSGHISGMICAGLLDL